jgi:hypothetical protein
MARTVTLVFIDTDAHVLTRSALEISLLQHRVDRVLVATDQPGHFTGYDTVTVAPFASMDDFNAFVTRRLPGLIETDVALLAHYDGFIINGHQYSPHFHHYDYIGAVWPMFDVFTVGNGGFCWQSKRMLEAVGTLDFPDDEPGDVFVCRTSRLHLEKRFGVRFAGPEIASHFSQELVARPWPSFGFHGIFHLPAVYRQNLDFLVDNISARVLTSQVTALHLASALQKVSDVAYQRFEARQRVALAEKLARQAAATTPARIAATA